MRNYFKNLNPDAGTKRQPISEPVGKKIIYLADNGNEANDGLTESSPRCDIRRVPEYLKDGFSVLLRAGSKWYIPDFGWKLFDILGTENEPLLVGTYGEGDAPVIAALHLVAAEAWRAESSGIMSTEAPGDVWRFYLNDRMIIEVEDLAELDGESFVQRDGRLYIKADCAPKLAELLARDEGIESNYAIEFKNVSYLTIQNLVIKGGYWTAVYGVAPSNRMTFDHVEFRSMFAYASSITSDKDNKEAYHNAYTVTNCIIDKNWSPRARYCYREDIYTKKRVSDGIFLTNAHIGAYVAGNIVRDFAHSAIDLQILDNRFKGIHNCIIERNVVSGTNSEYLRACETIGPDGLCTNNTVRYNHFYDLTNSSHVLGEYNKYYCNVFSFIEPTKVSKTVQPFAMDSMSWHYNGFEFVARGNVIANNTIYNCAGSLAFANNNYTCTVVNNIFVGWNYKGSVQMGETKEEIAFLNNCFFSESNDNVMHGAVIDGDFKLADLNAKELSSDNIFADPEFINTDECDFTLRDGSPCANAGAPISSFLDFEYKDMNGKPYDSAHPSLGAFSVIK